MCDVGSPMWPFHQLCIVKLSGVADSVVGPLDIALRVLKVAGAAVVRVEYSTVQYYFQW